MRNPVCYTGCLLIVASIAIGQTMPPSTITYISKVPFIVKTAVFSDKLSVGGRTHTLSGNIQIALAPRKTGIPSDHSFWLSKPLPVEEYQKIEYSYTYPKQPLPKWKPIISVEANNTSFPFGSLLAAFQLQYGDSATLSFRYKKNGKLIHHAVFHRPGLPPVIEGYRQKEAADSIDSKIKSLTANDPKKQWMGFDSLRGRTLKLGAGKKLDLLIRKNNWNRDSCILFRLYSSYNKAKPRWQLTGHLLSLDSLESNSQYLLDIRYVDMELINTYSLKTLPHWYQSTLGRSASSLIGLAVLLGVPYRYHRFRLQREARKRKQLEDQLTTVQTQLNPHFVFNALSSIEGLVSNQENERANEYLSSFSDIMRDTLKNSREPIIPLSEDLDTLEKYLRVEQLRFEFKWMMDIDPTLDLDQIEFPPMLLQPVVENAIKHGISGKSNQGLLVIAIKKRNNDLVITVEDNGGARVTTNQKNKGNGYGLQLTKDRIERLRELYKTDNISFNLSHQSNSSKATYCFENWIQAYENSYH
ncbi:MAG: histidine kinase [Sphingobacteriia bacterium]|nr:histidine kinase [Sphingobacteriia bacterium]